jgi:hypothetical protein
MLTGEAAFDRPGADETLLAIVHAPAPVPSTRQASVPAELDAIVARALAKPLDRRYQDAAVFAHDLRAVKSSLEIDLEEASLPWPDKAEGRTKLWWWVIALAALGGAVTWLVLRSAS